MNIDKIRMLWAAIAAIALFTSLFTGSRGKVEGEEMGNHSLMEAAKRGDTIQLRKLIDQKMDLNATDSVEEQTR